MQPGMPPAGLPGLPPGMVFAPSPAWHISLEWTDDEQRVLEDHLARFPPERYDALQVRFFCAICWRAGGLACLLACLPSVLRECCRTEAGGRRASGSGALLAEHILPPPLPLSASASVWMPSWGLTGSGQQRPSQSGTAGRQPSARVEEGTYRQAWAALT